MQWYKNSTSAFKKYVFQRLVHLLYHLFILPNYLFAQQKSEILLPILRPPLPLKELSTEYPNKWYLYTHIIRSFFNFLSLFLDEDLLPGIITDTNRYVDKNVKCLGWKYCLTEAWNELDRSMNYWYRHMDEIIQTFKTHWLLVWENNLQKPNSCIMSRNSYEFCEHSISTTMNNQLSSQEIASIDSTSN